MRKISPRSWSIRNLGRFPAANVHTITAGVTTRQLKEQLNWLARSAEPDDLVLIFLASHGTSRSQDTADVNYVVTSDTDLKDQDSLFATSIAMVDISDIVRSRVRARRTVILLDTCHSGGAGIANRERALQVSESAPSASVLERISQGIGRAILSSSQEDQSSYEGAPFQNGYFTHFLIEAMRRNNGMDTIEQMYPYLKDQVSKAAATKSTTRGAYVAGAAPAANTPTSAKRPSSPSAISAARIVLGAPAPANLPANSRVIAREAWGLLRFSVDNLRAGALHPQHSMRKIPCGVPPVSAVSALSAALFAEGSQVEWPFYGGDPGGMKYSAAGRVNTNNVTHLRVAWTWKTGEVPLPQFGTRPGMFENTPLMIDGVVYLRRRTTRSSRSMPRPAAQLWSYDPKRTRMVSHPTDRLRSSRSRGLARCRKSCAFS